MKGSRNRARDLVCLPLLTAALICAGAASLVNSGAGAQDIDMEAIFTCEDQDQLAMEPCNEGRQLFLDNCTACHNFVQVVLRQYDEGGWNHVIDRHRDRVKHLSDEEVESIQNYLAAKFNPSREPPELPAEIIEDFTDYQ